MGDHLRAGILPWHVTSYSCQLSLLPSVGREMSTGQTAVVRCAWLAIKGRMAHFIRG